MRSINNFTQAHAALEPFVMPIDDSTPYSLDAIKSFLARIDNPQNNVKVLHVAGTSGKTSTAYFIAALLHEAGHRVGLTVSPQIDEINERAQIDMNLLPEAEYCQELGLFLDLVDEYQIKLSHFEVLVAFAYWLFNKRQVEYAVVEVGLGGLLDGTNVVTRADKICIITDIGLDHTKVLGDTLPEIAYQKAGIIHDNNVVFMNKQSSEVATVIEQSAHQRGAKLTVIAPSDNIPTVDLPLFQQRNFGLSYRVAKYVLNRDNHDELRTEQIVAASRVYIPGRMELVAHAGKTIILDGSHNEQKIRALVASIKQQFPDQTMTVLVSFGSNKITSVIASLQILRELSDSIIITEFDRGQDELRVPLPVDTLAEYAHKAGFEKIKTDANPAKALELLYQGTSIGLVTGSFYLLHQIREAINNRR